MNELTQCANELIAIAIEHPADVEKLVRRMTPPESRHQRQIKVGKVYVQMTFTLDVIGTRKLWHLSLKDVRHIPLPSEVVDEVVCAFFGDGEWCEVPSQLHPGIVRQFVQFVERDREEKNTPSRRIGGNSSSVGSWLRNPL